MPPNRTAGALEAVEWPMGRESYRSWQACTGGSGR
jgi:hypothetical protein